MLVECDETRLLIDCGFTLKEAERRLARLNVDAQSLSAIVLTHEHSDHANGAAALARRHRLPLWATAGTAQALDLSERGARIALRLFSSHEAFAIGAVELRPFPVPHDAREPCQFVFTNGARSLGLLTDTGHVTRHIEECLAVCDALILECNHDRDMLAEGPYPPSLKARVGGPHGHLDNDAAAALLSTVDTRRLQRVVAAHLSEKNNTPWLVRSALEGALAGCAAPVEVAGQDSGLPWRELV